jgi:uncharacterized protein YbaR (Trm112 family)
VRDDVPVLLADEARGPEEPASDAVRDDAAPTD